LKTANPFPSLQISSPFGGVLWRAIALLLLVILCSEAVIRAGVWFKLWSEPELGSINAELDIKIQSLDALAKTETIDCVFLGSSQMDAAINPEIFSAEYLRLTGENLKCFNFSLGTLTAGPAGKMARLLENRYHPRILVFGISARDFSRDFGELSRSFKDDPWVRYSLGELNIPGWLTENSFFFRLASQLRSRFNPDYMDFHTGLLRSIKPGGYLYREGNELSVDSASSIPKYALYAEDLAGLDEVLAINSESVKLLVLEIPVYPGFLESYVENDRDNYFTLFREPIQERIAEAGVPFILSQEMVTRDIPDTDWNDILHLNFRGTDTFCRWFAQEAAAILSKETSMKTPQ
jgi:hypothetical protein